MSKNKVVDAIKATEVGRGVKSKSVSTLISLDSKTTELTDCYMVGYDFKAILGVTQTVDMHLVKSNPEIIDKTLNTVKRAVVRELYGEINHKLILLLFELRKEFKECDRPTIALLEELIEMTEY